jgi:hypothetical protein
VARAKARPSGPESSRTSTSWRAARWGYLNGNPYLLGAFGLLGTCPAGGSEIDRTLCDDRKLAAAQDGVWNAMKDRPKMIVSAMIGRAGK